MKKYSKEFKDSIVQNNENVKKVARDLDIIQKYYTLWLQLIKNIIIFY